MHLKTPSVLMLLGITSAFVAGALFYPSLPNEFVSHWNASGEPDSVLPKNVGVFLLPVFLIVVYAFYIVLPKIDPLKGNIEWFRKYYDILWTILFFFLLYVHFLMMLWNLGVSFNMTVAMTPALSILLYFIGVTMGHAKRNWFVGIRTPWTLSDDVVWEKTHRLGGVLFKISAAVALLGLFLRDSTAVIVGITAPAVIITIVTFVYSYFVYKSRHG
jgi:uncharacterized membrane protein